MFSRLFRKTPPPEHAGVTEWWTAAERIAAAPSVEAIDRLRLSMAEARALPDIAESQEEMVDGLVSLMTVSAGPLLPVVATQHRVIGAEICHFLAPAGLVGDVDAAGKVFLTSLRAVFAGGRVVSWPWHTVTTLARIERDLVLEARGREGTRLRCNTYGDALVAEHMARRLVHLSRTNAMGRSSVE